MTERHGVPRRVEYTPRHHSKALGRPIELDDIEELSLQEMEDLYYEVGAELSSIGGRMKAAQALRLETGRRMPGEEWAWLVARRGVLAPLHQRLAAVKARINRAERQEIHERRAAGGPTFEAVFKDVVYSEANPVDYQRWVLQTEIRLKAEAERLRKQKRPGS